MKYLSIITALFGTLLISAVETFADSPISAIDIMEKNYHASKLIKIERVVKMQLINRKGGIRNRKLNVVSALQEGSTDSNMLVRFIEPADVRGTAFLQLENSSADDDLWIYLPELFKSRRLVSSNKKDSFLGSDFAYGDMLPPKTSLYGYEVVGEEVLNEYDCVIVEAKPKDDRVLSNYGYSLKRLWIHKESFHEVRVEYYDRDERLLKVQKIDGITLIDKNNSRWLATYREMKNIQTGHSTQVEALHYTTNVKISSRLFSKDNLERL